MGVDVPGIIRQLPERHYASEKLRHKTKTRVDPKIPKRRYELTTSSKNQSKTLRHLTIPFSVPSFARSDSKPVTSRLLPSRAP